MPQQYLTNYGPFENLPFSGPATVEEYDAKGGVGECLKDAVTYLKLHSLPTDLNDVLEPIFEAFSGGKRAVDPVATAKAKERSANASDVKEKLIPWMSRIYKGATTEQKAELFALASAATASVYADPTPGRRAAGPGAQNLKIADNILQRDEAGIEASLAKLASAAPTFSLEYEADGKPNRESLAAFVKAATESFAG